MNKEENLKQAIKAVGGIEAAKKLIAEMEAPPKWDRQRCREEFLRIINGMELRREPSRPDVNLWDGLVNGERVTLFEQELLKTGIVWCQWKHVWKLFADHFSPEREVQALLKDLLEEHLKWRVETTRSSSGVLFPGLEEHLKWRVETTPE